MGFQLGSPDAVAGDVHLNRMHPDGGGSHGVWQGGGRHSWWGRGAGLQRRQQGALGGSPLVGIWVGHMGRRPLGFGTGNQAMQHEPRLAVCAARVQKGDLGRRARHTPLAATWRGARLDA